MATRDQTPRGNCQRCGRFVFGRDVGLVYDDWVGGWDADPLCPEGRGCRKGKQVMSDG